MARLDEGESGMVSLYAILGKPVTHSLSPVIHAAAYEVLGLDWQYSAFEVGETELEQFLGAHQEFSGFSLTMPLKRALFAYGQKSGWKVDATSEELEASNTLVRSGDSTEIFNTDVFGARVALQKSAIGNVESLAVLGSGATASSATLGTMQARPNIADFKVFSRNRDNASPLLEMIQRHSIGASHIQWLPLEAAEDFGGADLTVNTLPSDVSGAVSVDIPLAGGWVFDVNYAKTATAFSSAWAEQFRIDGREMLLWQAIAQIRTFLNGNPDIELPAEGEVVEAMRSALL
jgi:shikimate dehydrogenase